jgi:hypothetical protein
LIVKNYRTLFGMLKIQSLGERMKRKSIIVACNAPDSSPKIYEN